ncbi:hypothetical protein BpHYR1_023198 [Brachionus plicatilis]|uniref:Uncharacterized protein n=1 Tax=Brachionus plicatilis TaxID=10195 RepID=A0A3M7PUX6_BRAPC|nr:hypothetical protein BpHYR1_023198 [Brachionus plicatilis]
MVKIDEGQRHPLSAITNLKNLSTEPKSKRNLEYISDGENNGFLMDKTDSTIDDNSFSSDAKRHDCDQILINLEDSKRFFISIEAKFIIILKTSYVIRLKNLTEEIFSRYFNSEISLVKLNILLSKKEKTPNIQNKNSNIYKFNFLFIFKTIRTENFFLPTYWSNNFKFLLFDSKNS